MATATTTLYLIIKAYTYKHKLIAVSKKHRQTVQQSQDLSHQVNMLSARLEAGRDKIVQLETNLRNSSSLYADKLETWKAKEEKGIREDALSRSRATMRGQATEHLAPYMIEGLSPKDFRFVGGIVDYIVFDGISDYNSTEDKITIYLLDIKAGNSTLSKKQRAIRNAIQDGRIAFATYHTDKEKFRIYRCPTLEKITQDKNLES